jgi:hypothetical protein
VAALAAGLLLALAAPPAGANTDSADGKRLARWRSRLLLGLFGWRVFSFLPPGILCD